MLTHRSCWVSPSFCRHWCQSASQWSSAQRNCRGNSDNREGERRRQWTTSIFNCWNKLKTTIKFISKLSGNRNQAKIIRKKNVRNLCTFSPAALARFGWGFRQSSWCSWRIRSSPLSVSSGLQTRSGSHLPGEKGKTCLKNQTKTKQNKTHRPAKNSQ